jgi:hypothetical protein
MRLLSDFRSKVARPGTRDRESELVVCPWEPAEA